jgi:hypothetical protein
MVVKGFYWWMLKGILGNSQNCLKVTGVQSLEFLKNMFYGIEQSKNLYTNFEDIKKGGTIFPQIDYF